MMSSLLWLAVFIVVVTSVGILLVQDWRTSIILLAVQYFGLFLLTLPHLPLGMASVKVVSGWMSCAILGMTRSGLPDDNPEKDSIWPRGRLFRLFAAGMVGFIVIGGTPAIDNLMADAGMAVTAGGLMLMGMGFLHLGMIAQPLRVTLGLMTFLAGFEVLYAAVEGSVLVAALLASINLGLALVGSYLTIASNAAEIKTQ